MPALEPSAVIAAPQLPRNRESREPAKSLSLAAKLFMVSVAILLGFFIVRQIRGERSAQRLQALQSAAQVRRIAERPSLENLPTIEPLSAEEVLVLTPIDGHPCGRGIIRGTAGNSVMEVLVVLSLPSVFYGLSYKRSQWAGDDETPFVSVGVTLYPNSDWARYETKEIPDWNMAAMYQQDITTVTKYGNKILMNTIMRYPDGDWGSVLLLGEPESVRGGRFLWPSRRRIPGGISEAASQHALPFDSGRPRVSDEHAPPGVARW